MATNRISPEPKSNDNGPVELRADTIVYRAHDSYILDPELHHFSTWEAGDPVEDYDPIGPCVVVEVEAAASSEEVIGALKRLVAQIKARGLPVSKLLMKRKYAGQIVEMEREEPGLVRECLSAFFLKASDKGRDHE